MRPLGFGHQLQFQRSRLALGRCVGDPGRQRELDTVLLEGPEDGQIQPFAEGEEIPVVGWMVPVDDADVERVRLEIGEEYPGRKIGAHAREVAYSKYTRNAIAEQLAGVFEAIVSRKGDRK